jgi:hypothetical protein
MPLMGTFDCLDLREALHLLAGRGSTGHLHLRLARSSGTVVLDEGRVVGAELSEAGGAHAASDWRETAKELCCRALRDRRGRFEFVPATTVEPSPGEPMLAEHLTRAARHLAEQWAEVERAIPSIDAVPRLAEALDVDQVAVQRDQWPLLLAVDGRRTIAALARRLDLEPLRCCQLLRPLVDAGAVALPPAPRRVGARPATDDGEARERTTDDPDASVLVPAIRILGPQPAPGPAPIPAPTSAAASGSAG